MVRALSADEVAAFRTEGYVIVRQAFSQSRIQRLRQAVGDMLERAAAAEDAQQRPEPDAPRVSWINKDRRLPDRMGDYMTPAKFSPEFTDWLGEDVRPTPPLWGQLLLSATEGTSDARRSRTWSSSSPGGRRKACGTAASRCSRAETACRIARAG